MDVVRCKSGTNKITKLTSCLKSNEFFLTNMDDKVNDFGNFPIKLNSFEFAFILSDKAPVPCH